MTNAIMHGEEQSKLAPCGCAEFHFTYEPLTVRFDWDEVLRFSESV